MSKIRPKNLASFTTLIGVIHRRLFGSGKTHTAGESGCTAFLKQKT